MSQNAFAAAAGTTKAIIENVEMGRSAPPQSLVNSVTAFAGVIPESLLGPKPKDFGGKFYSKSSWLSWNNIEYSEEQGSQLTDFALHFVRLLLRAGAEFPGSQKKTPARFRALLFELNQWIFAKVQQQNLDWIISAIIQNETQNQNNPFCVWKRRGKLTLGECRSRFGTLSNWKEKDEPRLPDSKQVRFVETITPVFAPFVGPLEINGCPAFANGTRKFVIQFDLSLPGGDIRLTQEKICSDFMVATPPYLLDETEVTPPPKSKRPSVSHRENLPKTSQRRRGLPAFDTF
jgi:hypothetical protein